MESGRKNDAWVLWLSGVFAVAAIGVFGFALVYRDTQIESPPVLSRSVASTPAATSGEFGVVRVVDGDTITVVGSDRIDLSIRLRGIDAPELGQPYGFESKQALDALVSSAAVRLDKPDKGKYGRYVANVFKGDTWINGRMVAGGHAWCDQMNSRSEELCAAETEARLAHRGLWAAPDDPIAPWDWRARRK